MRSFPLLSLEQIYGAIIFYLSRRQDIDDYLAASEAEFDQWGEEINARARAANPELLIAWTRRAGSGTQLSSEPSWPLSRRGSREDNCRC